MARKVPVADEAIALVVLDQLAQMYEQDLANQDVNLTEYIVTSAAKVRYQQSTRQLVLTFDLGMSTAEDA